MKNELTVELIKKYANNLNNLTPDFPDKSMEIAATIPSDLGTLSILDVETTGVGEDSEITELAIVNFLYNKKTFNLLAKTKSYNEFNEPSQISKITPEISKLTNITQEMVKGKKINWQEVDSIIENSDFIIAHNAAFDARQIRKYLPIKQKILCSMRGADWLSRGVPNKKQEIIALHCGGFCYSGHRAINDVEALAIIIEKTGVLKEMIEHGTKQTMFIDGFVDAYGQDKIKKIITQQGINGEIFKLSYELDDNNKKYWFYECPNLSSGEINKIENTFWELVKQYNPNGINKIKVSFVDQNI